MSRLNKQTIEFYISAYSVLKDDESKNACFIKYRNNTEKYIDFIMEKESWYYGKWALFESGTYAMNIEESLLIEWHKNNRKEEKSNE